MAYQYGAGFDDIIIPTSGLLMASLGGGQYALPEMDQVHAAALLCLGNDWCFGDCRLCVERLFIKKERYDRYGIHPRDI